MGKQLYRSIQCYQTENSRFHFASLILGSRHLPDLPQLVESHLQQLQLDVGQATQPQALRSDLVIHWSRKWVVGCIMLYLYACKKNV